MAPWEIRYHVPLNQCYEGSRGRQAGKLHLHATEMVTVGRMARHSGEFAKALCGRKGRYTEVADAIRLANRERCPECVKRAERHGIDWPSGEGGHSG